MKTTKKFSALMLAVVMVFTMAITIFAAGDGTITINAATVDETYKLYKIFDATYAGDNVAYTFTKTEESFNEQYPHRSARSNLFYRFKYRSIIHFFT